jgi:hypothetical protein
MYGFGGIAKSNETLGSKNDEWEDNIKMDQRNRMGDMDWIRLAECRD